jgi:NADH-quinone oxidoreductase subunit E
MSTDKVLKSVFTSFNGNKSELIPILQHVQDELGYLPEDAMKAIAKFTGVSESNVFGVASFYSQFRFKPTGKNSVSVCRGTACHVKGAPRILEEVENKLGIKEGETTSDLEYSLETVACIGCCALSPCIMLNDDVVAKLTPKKITKLFNKGDGE